MSIGDFIVLQHASTNGRGSQLYNVALGATAINAGEPVAITLGATNVTTPVVTSGVVATDFYVGVAQTTSTATATLNGSLEVLPLNSETVYLVNPKTAATWNTQTKYDDLVGKRMTVDCTLGVYTLNATDNSANGAVVQALDIAKYPGKVAVCFRKGLSNLV